MAVVTVASNKGGVGKTTIAIELAFALGAVLVDLDFDAGSATGSWPDVGVVAPGLARRALVDGDGAEPRVLHRQGLPDLIPAHSDYGMVNLPYQRVQETIERWAQQLHRDLVVDTHPGYQPLSTGAMAAAHLTLIPVLLEERVLHAFDALAGELEGYPAAAVPARVPRWGPFHMVGVGRYFSQLKTCAASHGLTTAPPLSDWRDWPRRRTNRALLATQHPGRWVAQAQVEYQTLAEWVRRRVYGGA